MGDTARGLKTSIPAVAAPLPGLTSTPPNDLMEKPFPADTHRCDGESGGRRQGHTSARPPNRGPLVSPMEKPEARGGSAGGTGSHARVPRPHEERADQEARQMRKRITESLRLENTSQIIKSNCRPSSPTTEETLDLLSQKWDSLPSVQYPKYFCPVSHQLEGAVGARGRSRVPSLAELSVRAGFPR